MADPLNEAGCHYITGARSQLVHGTHHTDSHTAESQA